MKKKTRENIGLLVVSTLFSFLLLEFFSAYIYKHLPFRFNNGKRIVEIYIGKQSDIQAKIEPHPYLLYQNTKNYRDRGFLQHNSHRYRNKEFTLEKKNISTRILALGGSTTYMFPYIPDPNDTWISKLECLLKKNIVFKVQPYSLSLLDREGSPS